MQISEQSNQTFSGPYHGFESYQEALEALPQGQIAAMDTEWGEVNGRMLISCVPGGISVNNISKLTPKHYDYFVLRSTLPSLKEVCEVMQINLTSRPRYIDTVHKTLGVSDQYTLGRLMPMAYSDPLLRKLLEKTRSSGSTPMSMSGLNPVELDIWDGITQGRTGKQIAYTQRIPSSTVRTHTRSIRETLGIPDSIQMYRYAGAIANALAYEQKAEETATAIQPHIVDTITRAEQHERAGRINLDAEVVKKVDNPDLIEDLAEYGYIDVQEAEKGLRFKGLIAALIMNNPLLEPTMKDKSAAPIIREAIDQEVDYFYTQRKLQQAA
jgi:DNA-binding CsgD family transcriptional regulator